MGHPFDYIIDNRFLRIIGAIQMRRKEKCLPQFGRKFEKRIERISGSDGTISREF